MRKIKLNEEAIIKRLSNGELSVVYGGNGYDQKDCVNPPDTILIKRDTTITTPIQVLAGCGSTPTYRDCFKCIV